MERGPVPRLFVLLVGTVVLLWLVPLLLLQLLVGDLLLVCLMAHDASLDGTQYSVMSGVMTGYCTGCATADTADSLSLWPLMIGVSVLVR